MNSSTNISKIAPALLKAQQQMESAVKGAVGQVGQARLKYADLGNVLDAVMPALHANGIWLTQPSHYDREGAYIVTTLMHESGEWIADGGLFVPSAKRDAQGFGSALTYARRYALMAMLGVDTEDDDGRAASTPPPAPAPTPERKLSAAKLAELTAALEATGMSPKDARAKAATCPPADVARWLAHAAKKAATA